jgi:DNA-binding response OmpR family regulator
MAIKKTRRKKVVTLRIGERDETRENARRMHKGLRILIVEDDPDTLRWLQLHLEDSGHMVSTAHDLSEGRHALQSPDCDVLISDILLPDGTGWELLEQSGTVHPFFSIAMSGIGRSADSARSRAAGYRHHLFKPFPMALLDKLLAEAAGGMAPL